METMDQAGSTGSTASVQVASWALRISALAALVIGLELWSGGGGGALVPVHMVLGIVAIIAAWSLGIMQLRRPGGSRGLALGALVLGVLLPIAGVGQLSFFGGSGQLVAQLVHVGLAFAIIGMGEACAGRLRRAQPAAAR
jgi:hypothetical protein